MIGTSVMTGIVTGTSLPIFLFAVEFGIERRALRRAQNGRAIWWSTCLSAKFRLITGDIERTGQEIDFDPRHSHYMKCGELVVAFGIRFSLSLSHRFTSHPLCPGWAFPWFSWALRWFIHLRSWV